MSLIAAYAVPHPPLIVPAVGRGEEEGIASTIAAYQEVARRIGVLQPDTIVITSPHAPLYRDGFFVANTPEEFGTLSQFGCPHERMAIHVDLEFAQSVTSGLQQYAIPVAGAPRDMEEIDHATFVPLHFIEQTLDLEQVRVVRMGLSGLSAQSHRIVGEVIAKTAQELGRRCVFVASGDMSHKLKKSGPYGFAPEGPEFDKEVTSLFAAGQLEGLFTLDEDLCVCAAECGLRSFQIMAGALEATHKPFASELLSYEGPFGVGYAVAAFETEGAFANAAGKTEPSSQCCINESATGGQQVSANNNEAASTQACKANRDQTNSAGSDPLVALAREAVEHFVRTGRLLPVPKGLPPELTNQRAGAFVSLHEGEALRGCIGTIAPTQRTLAAEIITNGAHAATRDPRFPAVSEEELDFISYSVDVLGNPEPVGSLEQLDPKRYGVIVTRGYKRGLLLPDLEGVNTAEEQIAIAKQKAGIRPNEEVSLERFEVVRHTRGGQARR